MWERAFVIVIPFPITANPESNLRMREAFGKVVRIAAENGWGEYRTAPAFYDEIMDVYSFNNHAFRRLCERVKDAVDPRGILSAGRYGIYPAHMRKLI
jgi:4-cresol dehydrogenase (hydroxylating)